MNKRVLVNECHLFSNQTVILKGWAHRVRHLGNISFLLLKDRTGSIQCVLENHLAGLKVETESAIEVEGIVIPTNQQKNGFEIVATKVKVLSSSHPLPFEVNKKNLNVGLDTMLNHRVLSMRHEKVRSIFKVKSELANAFGMFLRNQGFTQIFTPKIVAQGAEGGANVFKLDYFGKSAYLAQSPQFYKQSMMASGLERVFEIASVFRAEEHASSRHLNEYVSLDLEMAFIEDFHELMELETNVLKYMFEHVQMVCPKELELIGVSIPVITTIPKLTVSEAQNILKEKYKKESPGGDLDSEGEKLIGKYAKETYQSEFVFITNYPKESRPMYAVSEHSFDLLYNGLEITSGGERIHEYETLMNSFNEKGLNPEEFSSYVEIFKYGVPPHGGFAIGLERVVSNLLKLSNVREASAFPRDTERLIP